MNEEEYVEGTATHEALIDAIEVYLAENEKFEEKNIKASAPRARKALLAELLRSAALRYKIVRTTCKQGSYL